MKMLMFLNPLRIATLSLLILSIIAENGIRDCQKMKVLDKRCPAIDSGGLDLPDRPVQLVRHDLTSKKLVIDEGNVKLLHKITGPVATVAIMGGFHQGISFLANQLMGRSGGFDVSYNSWRPHTKGIWMWGRPINMISPSGKNMSVIFLDVEGLGAFGNSRNYEAKIFAVANLLSSYLIYNSRGLIFKNEIDDLKLLSLQTNMFEVKSRMIKGNRREFLNNENILKFPSLLWVVRDFTGDTLEDWTSCKDEWLSDDDIIRSQTKRDQNIEITLLDMYKTVDCQTLFMPSIRRDILCDLSLVAEESDFLPDYRVDRDDLISKIQAELVPKEINRKPVTGIELASLLAKLVTQVNDGTLMYEFPALPNAFDRELEKAAVKNCFRFYTTKMEGLIRVYEDLPLTPTHLEDSQNEFLKESEKLLHQLLSSVTLDKSIRKASQQLFRMVNTEFIRIKDLNEKKILLTCLRALQKVESLVQAMFDQITLPLENKVIEATAEEVIVKTEEYFSEILKNFLSPDIFASYVKSIHVLVQSATDKTIFKNSLLSAIRLY